MKIIIDIGHPGHVHYFRNLYATLSQKGHEFLFISRKREVIEKLMQFYEIQYISRGKGKNSKWGKLAYMIYADFFILKASLKFNPDLFLSFSSPYAAQTAFIMGVPHIALNDTEHTDKIHKRFTYPFTKAIITPMSYQNNLGVKQIRLNCVIETLYLHPNQFNPNPSIYELLGLPNKGKYAIIRFVSWNAFHDTNQQGLSIQLKRQIIKLLEIHYKVFISSETKIEPEFEEYQIKIPPERMHDALAFASVFVGESGTMASECEQLGVPTIYVNSLPLMCYLNLAQEHGILKHFKNDEGVLKHLEILIKTAKLKDNVREKRDSMIKDFINPTKFLAWFIENYPDSFETMRINPEYQYHFR